MLPVEVGDRELRDGIAETRSRIASVPGGGATAAADLRPLRLGQLREQRRMVGELDAGGRRARRRAPAPERERRRPPPTNTWSTSRQAACSMPASCGDGRLRSPPSTTRDPGARRLRRGPARCSRTSSSSASADARAGVVVGRDGSVAQSDELRDTPLGPRAQTHLAVGSRSGSARARRCSRRRSTSADPDDAVPARGARRARGCAR